MTYMLGGILAATGFYTQNNGTQNSLGNNGSTITSIMTTENPGGPNVLTVTTNLGVGVQPNFEACGVTGQVGTTPADIIILTDSNGTIYERTVVSATANTVTYSGGPVTITGPGAALTFCSNVIVQNSNLAAICFITGSALEIVGIRFQVNPDVEPVGYGVYVENDSILFCSQLLFDAHNTSMIAGNVLLVANGSQIVPALADQDIAGHISIIGGNGGLHLNSGTQIQSGGGSGFFYIMQTTGIEGFSQSAGSLAVFNALQINGAGPNSYGAIVDGFLSTENLRIFNCAQGINATNGQFVPIEGTLLYNCTTAGVVLEQGSVANIPSAHSFTITPLNPSIGIYLEGASRFVYPNSVGVTFTPPLPAGFTPFIYDLGSSIVNGTKDFRTSYPGPYPSDAAASLAGVQVGGQYVSSYFTSTNPDAPYVIAQLH